MREYLAVIFCGIAATFLYNYFASFLRAVGNSVEPLVFLAVSAVLNIALDLWFVMGLRWGVRGAAQATVIAQYVSGIGIAVYALPAVPAIGVVGIWWSVPIGWFLADITGLLYYLLQRKRLLFREEQTN